MTPANKGSKTPKSRKMVASNEPPSGRQGGRENAKSEQLESARIIRQMRQTRQLSLRDAAEKAGIAHGTIAKLEKTPTPWDGLTVGTLRRLARAYNVSAKAMLELALGQVRTSETESEILDAAEPDWWLPSVEAAEHQSPAEDDSSWVRLELVDPRAAIGGPKGRVYAPVFAFEPPYSPDATLALRVDAEYLATWRAKNHPGVRNNAYMLVSNLLAGAGGEVVVALHKPSNTLVLYLASEAGLEEMALGVEQSTHHREVSLPRSAEPRFETEEWRVLGPVFAFVG